MSNQPRFPGEWRDQPLPNLNRAPYFAPAPKLKEPEPVAPHTKWWAVLHCDGRCSKCRKSTATAQRNLLPLAELEFTPVADGAYVLETSEHNRAVAVPYDDAIHAGWPRYAEHVCGGAK